jgi:hypothetical protein
MTVPSSSTTKYQLDWTGLDCTGLDWVGSDWIRRLTHEKRGEGLTIEPAIIPNAPIQLQYIYIFIIVTTTVSSIATEEK